MLKKMKRFFWLITGHFFLVMGIVGLFIPWFWPTVPFIIAASFCYAKGSKRLHQKLRDNRWFGGMLKDWEERHAISIRSKCIATGVLVINIIVIPIFAPAFWLKVTIPCILIAVIVFILTRETAK